MGRIESVRVKIDRARQHNRDLGAAIRVFTESKPYTIESKPHPVAEIHHTTLFVGSVQPVPNLIAPIVGDSVHNIRSSLDHLAWQLVEAGGGMPNKDTSFPICQRAQQYASAVGKGELKTMLPDAERVLRSVQPYITGDDTLSSIHQLDIIDKHRLLLTAVAAMDKWGVSLPQNRGTLWFNEYRFIPLVSGYEIANIPTSTYNRQQNQDFKVGVDIAFGKTEIAEGYLVLPTLNKMVEFVSSVIGRFEEFLA